MVLLLRNNFSTGPSGTTITAANSGDNGDDAWTAVGHSGASGWTTAYDLSPDRPTAEFVGKFETTTPTSSAEVSWGTAGFGQIYMRMYVYFSEALNNPESSPIFFVEDSGGAPCLIIGVNGGGGNELFAEDHFAANDLIMSSGITAGQWFRIEARIKFDLTAGEIDLNWYDDPDSDTPTETKSGTSWHTRADGATFYFGYSFPDLDLAPLRLSGCEVNDSDYPGPLPFKQKAVPGIQPSAIAIHNDVF